MALEWSGAEQRRGEIYGARTGSYVGRCTPREGGREGSLKTKRKKGKKEKEEE